MNAADIVILAVLAASLLFGLLRGFVSEVLSLVCWIAAFWVAWTFGDRVARYYGEWLHAPSAAIVAGYVTAFLAVLLAGALVGWAVHALLRRGGLHGGDRLLGAAFGLARGVLLVTFAVLMLRFTPVTDAAAWQQSALVQRFVVASDWLARELPPEVTHYLESGGQSLPALADGPISTLRRAAQGIAQPAAAASSSSAPRAESPAHGGRRDGVGQ